jgi:putative zinc finger protein
LVRGEGPLSGSDPNARLVPWYAAGTLGADESAALEAHLASCEECRALLALARGFRRLAPATADPALFEHVQAQRLVEFAEDPSALEPDARRFITAHIRTCPPCAEALEILEDLGSAPASGGSEGLEAPMGLVERARRAWVDLWRRLSRTVLRPGPAFAYLAALILLAVALPLRTPAPGPEGGAPAPGSGDGAPVPGPSPGPGPGPGPAPAPRPPAALLPPAIELPEEITFRGDAPTPPPLRVPLPAGAEVVPLVLVTSLEREDLARRDGAFKVTVTQGDRALLEQTCSGADFDRRGRLLLSVDAAAVAPNVPIVVMVVRVQPGDPADGEVLYRRAFLPVTPTAAPR